MSGRITHRRPLTPPCSRSISRHNERPCRLSATVENAVVIRTLNTMFWADCVTDAETTLSGFGCAAPRRAPAGATGPAIQYSIAGLLGRGLQYVFAPIGFNWQISIALVPGLAAREVAVSALGTVYAMSGSTDVAGALTPVIAQGWSIATGLSLLAWYVFAPQCLSTLAVVKRETNSWRYPLYMAAYLFALAYLGALVTYRVALALGGA